MTNEVLFFIWTFIAISVVLGAFKAGKTALYVVIGVYIILANIFVTKQITLFGMAATGGNSLYGAIFLATDLLSEYWGKKEARKAVLMGWAVAFVYVLTTQFFLLFHASPDDFVNDSLVTLFSFAPRIVIASLIAYLVSQTHDVWAFHFIKEKTHGKMLWLRNTLSTSVSQLFDTVIFATVAFWGVFPSSVVIQIIISTYVLKWFVAVIDTPFLYLSRILKPVELA